MAKFEVMAGSDGRQYIDLDGAVALIKEACAQQREICANVGKHHKFGYFKYKKEQMINAAEPKVNILEER
jgi:hypothetical protein